MRRKARAAMRMPVPVLAVIGMLSALLVLMLVMATFYRGGDD